MSGNTDCDWCRYKVHCTATATAAATTNVSLCRTQNWVSGRFDTFNHTYTLKSSLPIRKIRTIMRLPDTT